MAAKEISELYDRPSLDMMQAAEDAFERGANRIREIKNFARKSGVKRIGIAHCVSFPKETKAVESFLADEFEVVCVDCKFGHISKKEMLGCEGKGYMCNPAGQAEYLKEHGTELNISMGLCVGHDMVFNQKSDSPVTVLIVKDQANRNDPMKTFNEILSSGADV
jgi:uncharacterized metal-binding protein